MKSLIVGLLCLTISTGIFQIENVKESPRKQMVKKASMDSFNFLEEPTEWLSFEATAYTADCEGCIGITKTGYDVRDQSIDHRIVAVDPEVIPLHSIVEIEGMGIYRALDIGGAIKSDKIDVLMQSETEAIEFGRQQVRLRIIEEGAE